MRLILVEKLGNNAGTGNFNCDKLTVQGTPSSQCVKTTYSAGFGPGINVILAVSFNKDSTTIINNQLLTGSQYTAIDNKGFATTSLFAPVFDNSTNPPTVVGINADAANPDLTTPNVLLNASTFQNVNALPPPKGVGLQLSKCTPPLAGLQYPLVKIKGKLVQVCPDGNLPDGPD